MTFHRGKTTAAITVAGAVLALTGCGVRVPRADVIAAEGNSSVATSSATSGGGGALSSGATGGTVANPTPGTSSGPGASLPGGSSLGNATAGPGTAPTSSGAVNQPGQPCTKPGSTLVFGQVGTFSGIIGASQGASQPALKAWAAATNASGGIACHPVAVYSIDDGGDAGKAGSAVQTLVESNHAIAINAAVPVTINGIQSYIDRTRVPVVGGDLLASTWNTDPNFFPQGTSFESVIYAFARYAHQTGGTKYSFFYCVEATPCTAAQDILTKQGIGKKAGLISVGDIPITLAGSNFTQQCSQAKSKGADVVVIGAGANAVAAVGRDCAAQNYHPIYVTEALGANNTVASQPSLNGLIISSTVFPYTQTATPAERYYQDSLKKYAPNIVNSGGAASGWTGGELFKKAILNLGAAAYGDVTSAMVVKGLKMMRSETLGGLSPGVLNFTGSSAAPNRCAFILQVKAGAFQDPINNNQICEP